MFASLGVTLLVFLSVLSMMQPQYEGVYVIKALFVFTGGVVERGLGDPQRDG